MVTSVQSKLKGANMLVIIVSIVISLILISFIIFPPSSGKLKPWKDKNGKVLEDSIAEKIYVEINGVHQGMIIKGESIKSPVLLFLSGGPGIPEYILAHEYPTGLEKEFIVCYWDYRGTGLSYRSISTINDMSSEQYIADAIAVTTYLKERFCREKIYLMGHSFGTSIGIKTAFQSPELFYAYIGMSQITNQPESEMEAYTYMLRQYKKAGNAGKVKKFLQYPIMEKKEALDQYLSSSLRDTAMHELGVGTMHNMHSVYRGIFFPSLRIKEYTQSERINIWRGKFRAGKSEVAKHAFAFQAYQEVPALSIPVYFLAGKYDYTCCYSLQKKYSEQLSAPVKGFYTFENSAHSPLFEESEKVIDVLRYDVLNRG